VLTGQVGAATTHREIESSLDAVLRTWKSTREPSSVRRPSARRLRQAHQQIEQRVAPPTRWSGRWALVHRVGVWGGEPREQERALRFARQLLQRYGVVTRECLAHEDEDRQWASVYPHLELMELRGEVRRGYFVRGFSGAQFALPEAVERLREQNVSEEAETAELALLNAWDPANFYGSGESATLLPGANALGQADEPSQVLATASDRSPGIGAMECLGTAEGSGLRFARLPGNYLVLQRGFPVLVYENGGSRWTALPHATEGTIRESVQLCLKHLTREGGLCSHPRRVLVKTWNGASPLGSAAQALLEGLGFRREPPVMVWDGGNLATANTST